MGRTCRLPKKLFSCPGGTRLPNSCSTQRARICQVSRCRAIIMGLLGGIAQLGERLHGMQEVSGSIPLTSTSIKSCRRAPACVPAQASRVGRKKLEVVVAVPVSLPGCDSSTQSRSSRGLGHHPFTVSTRVRISYGTPPIPEIGHPSESRADTRSSSVIWSANWYAKPVY